MDYQKLLDRSEPWLEYAIRLNVFRESRDTLVELRNTALADSRMTEFIGRGFAALLDDSRENGNGMWAATLSVWLPKAAYLLSKSAAEGGNPSWRSILYTLECPRTFIFGEYSLPDSDVQVLTEHGIQIEIVRKAGHSMAWENPAGLAAAISRGMQSAK